MRTSELNRRHFLAHSGALATAAGLARYAFSQQAENSADPQKIKSLAAKGIQFFKTKGQADDGSFSKQVGIGVTALAATAMLRHGVPLADPSIAKALKFLTESVQPTGGIHLPNGRLQTYETCVAVVCFSEANVDGRYDAILKNADKFIKEIPFDAAEGHDQSSFSFGGAGYGAQGRPDLSNTAYLIDALKAAGNGPDSEAMKNALVFVSRCQNLASEHNTTPFADKINDGGFYYTPFPGRDDGDAGGGLRSYGAMSYSGLKSMVFAGVKADDSRVKAVIKWIGKNYDLKTHPGQGLSGLYYYYHTFTKALDAFGVEPIEDDKGQKHYWRKDLTDELAAKQKDDGSWVNENKQFFEGDSNLCTSFALLALSYCKK